MNNSVKIIRRTLFLASCLLASQLNATVNTEPAAAATTAAAAEELPSVAPIVKQPIVDPPMLTAVDDELAKVNDSTADHSKFDELKKDFKSGQEVTEACLSCHTEAAKQVHSTKHWTW